MNDGCQKTMDTQKHARARTHTHTLSLVVHSAVQYKQRVYTWSICQSNLQVLQRKLQRRSGQDTITRNLQQHTDRTHAAVTQGSLQPAFNQIMPLHRLTDMANFLEG